MLLSLFQAAAVLLVLLYLGYMRRSMVRRGRQSWASLLGRLHKEFHGRELSPHFLWKEGLSAGPEETWESLGGLRGLWAIFQNARVLMEMAEFAARTSNVDQSQVDALRDDAAQIRLCVAAALVQCAMHHANENVRMRAFHAASMYTGMAARMTEMLQNAAAPVLPEFVAAM